MKTIHTKNAPAAVGPYSQAVEANELIFLSGQIGIDPKTNTLVESLESQTHQVIKNLQAILNSTNLTLENIVKTTIYLTNINNFTEVNDIYATYFPKNKPARATIEVSNLPKGALVEIDAIATKTYSSSNKTPSLI